MKIYRTLLLLVLFSQLIAALPQVIIGFLIQAGIAVITTLIKAGVDALIDYGVSVAEKNENEKMKEAALKYRRDPNGLSDEEKEVLVKGILMRNIINKMYRTDYRCNWDSSKVMMTFDFSYKNGTHITHGK